VRETVMTAVGGDNLLCVFYQYLVKTVSITINAQTARSIDDNLLCVFYQYLVKEASSRHTPLCISDDEEFTKEGFRRSPPVLNSQYEVANLFHVLYFLICLHRVVLFCLP